MRDDVFLPREFADLGGEDQVLRALRGLVREGGLVRLGYGVNAPAIVSRLSGEPLLYVPDGFSAVARPTRPIAAIPNCRGGGEGDVEKVRGRARC